MTLNYYVLFTQKNYYVLFTRDLKVKKHYHTKLVENLLALLSLYCLVMAKANQIYAQAK